MRTIDRAAFVVRPREPYLRWAASLDDQSQILADGLQDTVSIYLVPEDPRGEAETAPIADYFEEIFVNELEAWSVDESTWPVRRDLETFLEWFHLTGESIVTDLADGPIRHEVF